MVLTQTQTTPALTEARQQFRNDVHAAVDPVRKRSR